MSKGNFLWRGKCCCLLCHHHFLLIWCLLTHCRTCMIHQSMHNSMLMKAIARDWPRSGGSCRKVIFCTEVSAVVCCATIPFVWFDVSDPLSCLYDTSIKQALNADKENAIRWACRCGMVLLQGKFWWFGKRLCCQLPSLYLLLMPSNQLLDLSWWHS